MGGSQPMHPSQSTETGQREDEMLHLVGATLGLLIIIVCFSKGLKDGNRCQRSMAPESSANAKMKPLSDEDVHLLARVLSLGLVDADPNYLHHLKGYRDLHGC